MRSLSRRVAAATDGGARESGDFIATLNPNSLEVLLVPQLEPSFLSAASGELYQFERVGYFCVDKHSAAGRLRFNRALTLKDSWAKLEKKLGD